MEFVKGRIITDPDLKDLSPKDRRAAWFSLVSTLAWLHSIDPDSIGLQGFGKKTGFYTRHCNTFSRIEAQQSKVKDINTGKELGRAHPNFDEIVDYVRKNVPSDRTSIVHGDYKFDNVILHPTEPRVIAILDWELSTIGHPLMDAVYVVGPYWNRASQKGQPVRDDMGGAVYDPENQKEAGMPSMDELVDEYARITGWDPRKDQWEVAKIFHLMRVSILLFDLCSMDWNDGNVVLTFATRAGLSAMVFRRGRSVGRRVVSSRMFILRIPRGVWTPPLEWCARGRRRSRRRVGFKECVLAETKRWITMMCCPFDSVCCIDVPLLHLNSK